MTASSGAGEHRGYSKAASELWLSRVSAQVLASQLGTFLGILSLPTERSQQATSHLRPESFCGRIGASTEAAEAEKML